MKTLLSLFAAWTLALTLSSAALADANIEPKNPLEKERGVGNMDVPTETVKKAPAPTPRPTPKPSLPGK
ncbi:hypothetical protein F9K50_11300 [bacterium]|nr:MAG: hypothetical protein F9K50_11300 [bacterium]